MKRARSPGLEQRLFLEVALRYVDWIFAVLIVLVHAFVVYLFAVQRLFRRFLFLSMYLLLVPIISVGAYVLLIRSHWASYRALYQVTESVLSLVLFLGVWQLSARLVAGKRDRRLLLWGALAVAALLAFEAPHPFSRLSSLDLNGGSFLWLPQDLFFTCGFLVLVLWIWKLRNPPQDQTAARLVNVLGVYFALCFAAYVAGLRVHHADYPLYELSSEAAAWLPLGSGFALLVRNGSSRANLDTGFGET